MTRPSGPPAWIALALGLGVGCTSPAMTVERGASLAEAPPFPERPDAPDEPIGPGDVLVIVIADLPRVGEVHTMQVRVDPSTPASIPALGSAPIVASSTSAVREELRRRLRAEEVLRDPEVTVFLLERRAPRLTVLGAVGSAGRHVLPRSTVTAAEAFALAGGLLPDACETAWLRAPDGARRVDVTAAHRSSLQAGDVLYVPFAGRYRVEGHVARPGSYALPRRTTVVQALALAGGVDATGSLHGVHVRRRSARGEATIEVDLVAVSRREAADPELTDGDVVEVPQDAARWLADGARSVLRAFDPGGPRDAPR